MIILYDRAVCVNTVNNPPLSRQNKQLCSKLDSTLTLIVLITLDTNCFDPRHNDGYWPEAFSCIVVVLGKDWFFLNQIAPLSD